MREESAPVGHESIGPRGGATETEAMKPDWRRAGFNGGPDLMLHRFEKPDTATVGKKDEQPWHRMAAFMLLAGRTNSEIAAAAQVTPALVSHLRSQRWFQELLAILANEAGEAVTGVLAAEALASVEKLVALRDGAESERTQLSAALALLEHANGKPVQKVLSSSVHVHASPQEEMDAIQQELAALRGRSQKATEA